MTAEIIGGILLILVNIFVWVFLWGKRVGKVNTRLKNLKNKNPVILPQCAELFTEIKESLSEVKVRLKLCYFG